MADDTGIEWADATWNPVVGCSIVSPGCTHCYAMRFANARLDGNAKTPRYAGTTQRVNGNAVWTGKVTLAPDRVLSQPLRWKRPRRIFVNSMGDLFHESVPDEWIDIIFAVMALAPQHTFLVLTKRADRMRAYVSAAPLDRVKRKIRAAVNDWTPDEGEAGLASFWYPPGWAMHKQGCRPDCAPPCAMVWTGEGDSVRADLYDGPAGPQGTAGAPAGTCYGSYPYDGPLAWPLPNVWLGVSCEDQPRADARVPALLNTPAAVRFISAEPLLGRIDFSGIMSPPSWVYQPLKGVRIDPMDRSAGESKERTARLDWIIAGGESGKGARPMHPDWARTIRDQCAAAGVPFFFKQWGEWATVPVDTALPRNRLALVQECEGGDIAREELMGCVGKRAAGRTLDGATHDAFPEAQP